LIGATIESFVQSKGFKVCPLFIGHGVGHIFHQPPPILHTFNQFNLTMKPGMTFTIEPVVMEGPSTDVDLW